MNSRPNRLARESSPYLQQHAHNPVDWYPWGEEALAAARTQDKPIFLSVGYSSCHWCHVMERESFDDPETASLLNEHFVCIKVDREERPDLDELYMQAVQLFTGGHGGWPMSVWLTPALEPFLGGTYFPPTDRHGMPGFRTVLRFASGAYRDRRDDVARTAEEVVRALRSIAAIEPDPDQPGTEVLDGAYAALASAYDARDGGFGGAPKFPHAMGLGFLLRYHARTGAAPALEMVRHTLRRMARGGIYDQLGGGFHRYATDARWLVPHFEKMLYDNALLVRTGIELFQTTGDAWARDVALETLDYIGREMTSPEGAFYSAQDADSEGREGAAFVWTPAQIAGVVGAADARVLCAWFDVRDSGNFEHGTSVLSVPREPDVVAAELGLAAAELAAIVERGRAALLAARRTRAQPARDDKIIVAWNALAIAAFATAGRVLDRPDLVARGAAAAEFVLGRSAPGKLFRTALGDRVGGRGFLDDYAGFVAACIDLYEATFEPRWIETARRLDDELQAQFWDEAEGAYWYSGREHESLLARSRQPYDHATPSGNSIEVANLLRLALLCGDTVRRERALGVLRLFGGNLRQHPAATAEMLCGLDLGLGPALQVALGGTGAAARALARAVFEPFVPRKVVAGWPGAGRPASIALLEGREPPAGGAAAWVCRDFACGLPETEPEALRRAVVDANRTTGAA